MTTASWEESWGPEDVRGLSEWKANKAFSCVLERDACGFLCVEDNLRGVDLVWRNHALLRQFGILEPAFVHAVTGTRVNNHHDYSKIRDLIRWILGTPGGLARLRASGGPVPRPGPHVLYRGIGGLGSSRRLRGFAWTSDLEVARWFAERAARFGLAAPSVITATVPTRWVLFCSHERQEQEFFVNLPPAFPVAAVPSRNTTSGAVERVSSGGSLAHQ